VLILIIHKLELLSVVTATHSKPLPEISKALEVLNHRDRVEGIPGVANVLVIFTP
jgi:hypothetical protein